MEEKIFYNGCPAAGCHCYCVLKAHVQDDKLTRVESADYPGNLAQRSICIKGLASPRLVYHPDRLKYPMKRVGKRGEGKWQRLSWDEAFDQIGERLLEIRAKYGPESVKVTPTGSSSVGLLGRFVGNRFANLWGSGGEFEGHGPLADGGPLAANMFYLGKSLQSHETRDLALSKMIIMWGWNPAETRSPDMPAILDAKDRGAKVVVIGPCFDATAAKADQWLPVRESSDAALALAMINVIIENKVYDEDYIKKYTVGTFLVREDNQLFLRTGAKYTVWDQASDSLAAYDAAAKPALLGAFTVNGIRCKTAFQLLKERALEYAPEKAAKLCNIPPETIRDLALEYAATKPAAIRWSYGMARTYMSTLGCRAVIVLGAITGNIGVPGGGISDTDYGRMPPIGGGAGKATGIALNSRAIEMPPGAPGTKFLPGSTTPMKGWALVREGKPYPIKALLTSYQNKLHPTYGQFKSEMGILEPIELFVVMDIINTRTAEYADFSLPSATVFERDDLQVARNYILKMEKAIEPLYEAKNDIDIWAGIAQRVGLGDYFKYTADDYIKMAMDIKHPSLEGITFERLQKEKLIRGNLTTEPIIAFSDMKFPTPSGRIEFYKERLLTFGEELPLYKERLESPRTSPKAKEYPLTYFTLKNRTFTGSMMSTVDWMRKIDPEPVLDMNPVDAGERGIKDGDLVLARNDRGRVKLKANLTEAMPPGVVNCDHGWWYQQFAEGHYTDLCQGIDDLSIVNPSLDIEPIISDRGSAAHLIYWDCLVEVQKA